MKASTLLRAYMWAELGFIGYLLLRKEPLSASLPAEGQQALEALERTIKEKSNADTEKP